MIYILYLRIFSLPLHSNIKHIRAMKLFRKKGDFLNVQQQ